MAALKELELAAKMVVQWVVWKVDLKVGAKAVRLVVHSVVGTDARRVAPMAVKLALIMVVLWAVNLAAQLVDRTAVLWAALKVALWVAMMVALWDATMAVRLADEKVGSWAVS
jgi:hypothetical protein